MNCHKPIVVGIGELLWDIFPDGKHAGGAPVNFVYHASRMGAQGYAISAVGNDPLGHEILTELQKHKIEYICETSPHPTGYVQVSLKAGIPSYCITENVAWDHIPLSPAAVACVQKADAICFGTLALRHPDSKKTVKQLLAAAPPHALRFFDINLRQQYYSPALVQELLQEANLFKINDEELSVVCKIFNLSGTEDDVCRALLERYRLRYVILTAGAAYSTIYSPDETSRLDTPKVSVVDTVGAGDSFSGAFTAGILTGQTLRQAHQQAVKTAAFVCTQPGAWPDYTYKDI